MPTCDAFSLCELLQTSGAWRNATKVHTVLGDRILQPVSRERNSVTLYYCVSFPVLIAGHT